MGYKPCCLKKIYGQEISFSGFYPEILLVSCKKDRTCSCTLTRTGTAITHGKVEEVLFGLPSVLPGTIFSQSYSDYQIYDNKIINSAKGAAKNNCASYSQSYSEPFKS